MHPLRLLGINMADAASDIDYRNSGAIEVGRERRTARGPGDPVGNVGPRVGCGQISRPASDELGIEAVGAHDEDVFLVWGHWVLALARKEVAVRRPHGGADVEIVERGPDLVRLCSVARSDRCSATQ